MPEELLPTSADDTSGDAPQGEKKSGMFRPVWEEPPLPTTDDDGDTHIVVVEATTTWEQPIATPSVETVVVEPTLQVEEATPVVEEAPIVEEAPAVMADPVATPVEETVQQPAPVVDPVSTPPTTTLPPVAPVVTASGWSWKRVLLLIVFVGALAFFGYKYWFVASPDVAPELPVDTNTMPTLDGTWVEEAIVMTGAGDVATGEVATGEVVVATGTAEATLPDGPQTFTADSVRSGLQFVTFQYPQWWTLSFEEIQTSHNIQILNEQGVLQARVIAFGTTDFETEFTLVKDALESIKLSEKPFLNESFVGAIGIYSWVLLEDPLPGGNFLASLAQPIITFQDKKNQLNYLVILQPNMDKQVFTVLRSLRLP
jgi:hypothetical protein